MIRYMLDTNTCIAIIKHRPGTIKTRMATLSVEEVGISGMVAAELWYGVAFSQKKKQNEKALKDFLDYVTELDWPFEAGKIYGRIRADLKGKGTQELERLASAQDAARIKSKLQEMVPDYTPSDIPVNYTEVA